MMLKGKKMRAGVKYLKKKKQKEIKANKKNKNKGREKGRECYSTSSIIKQIKMYLSQLRIRLINHSNAASSIKYWLALAEAPTILIRPVCRCHKCPLYFVCTRK
ncbi:hypothetical protein TorRG33x02_166300 [Trema orientale]|uniref:Uncharacterized protein n=1 Tax=Trema orientale TaxID=63057 RepID=A0A2P5EQ21_TREOI|nr:hypothetical protein TorRG33x02_166300 [Trema orientale]